MQKDLTKKMVFLGGPRQCGKTWLARHLIGGTSALKGTYFNWDFDDDQKALLERRWNSDAPVIVFDELHKFPRWKNWLKGVYDKRESVRQTFLVTGSARLDLYRRGGDSLLGRYHYWRLHPFSLSELPPKISEKEGLKRLLLVGGFPEPFLDNDPVEARRWRQERLTRVLKEDVRDLEPIRDIQTLGLFVKELRKRVGAPIVLSNIAQDLQVAPKTLKHWVEVLEQMYLIFVVRPYTKGLGRSLQKPFKVFFFDNGDVEVDEGARFENFVATSLLKELHFREDCTGVSYELCYIRDKEQREVDFAIVKDDRLVALVEAKWGDGNISPHLAYYAEKTKPKVALQVVGKLDYPVVKNQLELRSALDALTAKSLAKWLP